MSSEFNTPYQKKKAQEQLYARFNNKCGYCGCDLENGKMIMDFIDDENKPYTIQAAVEKSLDWYMPSCFYCNRYKQGFKLSQFRTRIKEETIKRIKCELAFTVAKKYGLLTQHELTDDVEFYYEKMGWTSDKTWDNKNQRPIDNCTK